MGAGSVLSVMVPRRLKYIVLPLALTVFALSSYKFLNPRDFNHAENQYSSAPGRMKASTGESRASTATTESRVKYYYNSCDYRVVFLQNEVNAICDLHPVETPVCQVTHIDHLNQLDFRSAQLKLPSGQILKMFVHPPKDLISNSILGTGGWDEGGVNTVLRTLAALPSAALIDIGCNLGVFSLRAASDLGRRVVAIDANYQNVIRLRKSVLANGLQDRVRIFWNALAAERGVLRMRLPTDCNIGGGMPTEVLQAHWLRDPVAVRTAGLDEIIGLCGDFLKNASRIVVKMDIEGGEWGAIATAAATFRDGRVPAVLMEWRGTQIFHPDKADDLLRFFASRNYTAHKFWGQRPTVLNNADHKGWPGDVLWVNDRGLKLLNSGAAQH